MQEAEAEADAMAVAKETVVMEAAAEKAAKEAEETAEEMKAAACGLRTLRRLCVRWAIRKGIQMILTRAKGQLTIFGNSSFSSSSCCCCCPSC